MFIRLLIHKLQQLRIKDRKSIYSMYPEEIVHIGVDIIQIRLESFLLLMVRIKLTQTCLLNM